MPNARSKKGAGKVAVKSIGSELHGAYLMVFVGVIIARSRKNTRGFCDLMWKIIGVFIGREALVRANLGCTRRGDHRSPAEGNGLPRQPADWLAMTKPSPLGKVARQSVTDEGERIAHHSNALARHDKTHNAPDLSIRGLRSPHMHQMNIQFFKACNGICHIRIHRNGIILPQHFLHILLIGAEF